MNASKIEPKTRKPRVAKAVSPLVAALQIPESKKAHLVKGKIIIIEVGVEMSYEERLQQAIEHNLAKMRKELQNLPALQGSEAQVKWASALRTRLIQKVTGNMAAGKYRDPHAMMQAVQSAQQASAKWWIDHRYDF